MLWQRPPIQSGNQLYILLDCRLLIQILNLSPAVPLRSANWIQKTRAVSLGTTSTLGALLVQAVERKLVGIRGLMR